MRAVALLLWFAFALTLGVIGYRLLAACDLGAPIFGLRYCEGSQPHTSDPNRYYDEKYRASLDRLHELELRLARLPICVPQQAKPPDLQPQPEPAPTASPQPVLEPKPNLSRLNCMQSKRFRLSRSRRNTLPYPRHSKTSRAAGSRIAATLRL